MMFRPRIGTGSSHEAMAPGSLYRAQNLERNPREPNTVPDPRASGEEAESEPAGQVFIVGH